MKCRVCNFDKFYSFKKFSENKHKLDIKASGSSKLSTDLDCCSKCGHVFQNPEHPQHLMEKLYSSEDDSEFVKFNDARIKSFKNMILKLRNHNINIGSIGLDVGCAGGAFPKACKDLKIDCIGLEPSKFLSDYGRKKYDLDIRTGFLNKVCSEFNQEYDFISFWDVLEHIYDINQELDNALKLLKKNGYLIINVPLIGTLPEKLLGNRWPMYLDVHIHFFTKKSLLYLLLNKNMELVKDFSYWQTLPLPYILKRGLGFLGFNKLAEFFYKNIPTIDIAYYIGQRCFVFKRKNEK